MASAGEHLSSSHLQGVPNKRLWLAFRMTNTMDSGLETSQVSLVHCLIFCYFFFEPISQIGDESFPQIHPRSVPNVISEFA